jgi:hypothetical protein
VGHDKIRELGRMSDAISNLISNKHYHSYSKLHILPEVNKKCFVQVDENRNNKSYQPCYRGMIEKVDKKHECCQVRMLDYGFFRNVPFYNMYPHKRLQDGTAKLHYRAIRCLLQPDAKFSYEAQTIFRDLVSHRNMTFELVVQMCVNGVKCWHTRVHSPLTKANILNQVYDEVHKRHPSAFRLDSKGSMPDGYHKRLISRVIESNRMKSSSSVEDVSSKYSTRSERPNDHQSRTTSILANKYTVCDPTRPRSKSADSYSNYNRKSQHKNNKNKRNLAQKNFQQPSENNKRDMIKSDSNGATSKASASISMHQDSQTNASGHQNSSVSSVPCRRLMQDAGSLVSSISLIPFRRLRIEPTRTIVGQQFNSLLKTSMHRVSSGQTRASTYNESNKNYNISSSKSSQCQTINKRVMLKVPTSTMNSSPYQENSQIRNKL